MGIVWMLGAVTAGAALFSGDCLAADRQSLDPLAVDHQHYQVDVENQWVRAFREKMAPFEKMPMHQHPGPGAVIVLLTDRHNRLTSPEGTSRELRDHAGAVMWSLPSTHRSENLNNTPFEAIQIEPRRPAGAAARPPFTVDKTDATVVDPAHYHVELENEYVRVLRVTIGPHERLAMHTHPQTGAVLVQLTDQNLRLTTSDGTARISHYAAGEVRWVGPGAAHQDENLSEAPLKFIRVELKSAVGRDLPK
jgi:quercetin dioxygenase-like cupin family protein